MKSTPEQLLKAKLYRESHREHYREYFKRYDKIRRKYQIEKSRKWYAKNAESECLKKMIWRKENPKDHKAICNRQWARRKRTPSLMISQKLQSSLRSTLLSRKGRKTNPMLKLIGCSLEEFKKHLESLFRIGMTLENYGRGGWTLDHKVPRSAFNLLNVKDQMKCFHFTNLRPVWERENMSKGSKILTESGVLIYKDGSVANKL
jgi:hypothetical protein